MQATQLSAERLDTRLWDAEGVFLQSLADAADVGMIVLGEDHRVLLWNHWMELASRIESASVLGHRLDDVFSEPLAARLPMAVEQALMSSLSSYLSPQLNGRVFPLNRLSTTGGQDEAMVQSVVVKPLGNEAGDRLCLIQIFDVSQSSDRERLLRRMRNELEERVIERTAELTQEIQRREQVEDDLREAMSKANAANTAKTISWRRSVTSCGRRSTRSSVFPN